MDPLAFIRRQGQHAPPRGEGFLVLAQVFFEEKGEPGDVLKGADFIGGEVRFLKFLAVKGAMIPGVLDDRPKFLLLQIS
jgi:hypothetical protein